MARPTYLLQAGLVSSPDDPIASTTWTDLTSRLDVAAGVTITRGRTEEQGAIQPSTFRCVLDNRDGALTPGNPSSPYAPNVKTGKRVRLQLTYGGLPYWRFTGDASEWPLAWSGGPAKYAETNLSALDRFARLGELGEYRSTLEEDVLDDEPLGYWPLTEPAGSASAGDVSPNAQPPMTVAQIGSGGTLVFGYDGPADSLTNDRAVADFYVGRQTGAKLTPATNVAGYPQGKYLRAPLKAPTAATSTGATVQAIMWHGSSGLPLWAPVAFLVAANGSYFGIHRSAVDGGMTAIFVNNSDGTSAEVAAPASNPLTDQVFLLTATLDIPSAGNVRLSFYRNGSPWGTPVTFASGGPLSRLPEWTEVRAGGRDKTVDGVFRGNLSHVAVWDAPLSQPAMAGHWFAAFQGRDGSGNTSFSRLGKLCTYSGLGTLGWFNGGNGFASQLVGPQEIAGNPIEAMRLVETTEGGMFYLKGDGLPRLNMRGARYNAAPQLTVSASKLDPDALTFRGDDYGLVNDVTGSRPDGATARVVNETSRVDHGRRKGTVSAVPATDDQLRALTAWQANTYGVQRNRVTGVKISLLNDPSLIPTALGLEPGGKIRITDLPSQAPASALDLFVEGWTEVISETEWSMAFTTSPAEVGDVWQIGVAGRNEIGVTTRIPY